MTTEEHQSAKHRSWIDRLLNLLGREPQNREELTEVLRHAEERDVVSSDMLGMMERILHVADMQVREVMIPKAQMVVVKKNQRLDEILPLVIESGHSRFPVIDPADGEIVGILLAKDLLPYCYNRDVATFELANIMRAPVVFTPQSKRLDIMLREFRINRNHMAIVLDEYGHVAGVVTIEDVLEQIVGEIEDEYDLQDEHEATKK